MNDDVRGLGHGDKTAIGRECRRAGASFGRDGLHRLREQVVHVDAGRPFPCPAVRNQEPAAVRREVVPASRPIHPAACVAADGLDFNGQVERPGRTDANRQ